MLCDMCRWSWFSFCFFKQKTAYEMRISDWSSDVCSSDLTMKRTTILLAGLLLAACHQQQSPPATAAPTPAALAAHSAEFKREVLNPADGVYVAVGYGIANSILVVGDGGVIVVDTTETAESARAVLASRSGRRRVGEESVSSCRGRGGR